MSDARAGRRRVARWTGAALVAAGLVAAGALATWLPPGPLVPAADAAVAGVSASSVRIAAYDAAGGGVEVAPRDGAADVTFVLYPGGRVRPHAYAWIGVALAPAGVRTLIPTLPLDLAVFARDRLDALREADLVGAGPVVLGGHSLGGAMAVAHLARRAPDAVDGLVLMGAYPAAGDDLSDRAWPTLVLAAELDGLATEAEVTAGLERLPGRADLVAIEGAVHAFFGRYGPQRGDGRPTVPRAAAERAVRAALEGFFASLR
ncbi:MAG: alpha/beta fold hydrolase [Trueperaceae bacterium]|nr:alpha/beta fold hydrolase [Trueperaceae bacterium]